MAYTTSDLQRLFEDAWDGAPDGAFGLRDFLRQKETSLSALLGGGTITSTGTSGRSVSVVFDGRVPGSLTIKDLADAYRELIRLYGVTAKFLRFCNLYGFDPAKLELTGPPSPLPEPLNPVTPTTDIDVAEWLMGSDWLIDKQIPTSRGWIAHLFPVTECLSDYNWSRIPPGLQYV